MNNSSAPGDSGQERPNEAEPFFPSEGPFNPVVPLSEIGQAPAPLPPVDPADVGKPAEAEWAREAHRAGLKEEEETLVPIRAGGAKGARPPWVATAAVIALSVAAGVASGTYLIRSSQRAPAPQPSAQVAAEAPSLPPVPATEEREAAAEGKRVEETAEAAKPSEAAKAGKSNEVAHAPKQAPPPQPAPRAERVTRAAAEAGKVMPAPKPSGGRSAAPSRPRLTTAEKRPPALAPPISSPPPAANSKKVIQWP